VGTPRTDRSPGARTTVVGAAGVVAADGLLARAEVVVEGGVITDVRPARGAVPDVVLAPGFVDLQVNGIGPVDVATASGPDWAALDAALLAQGVTTWCPTLTSAPRAALEDSLARVAAARRRPAARRPDIAGAHLEGPFLALPGAHRPDCVQRDVDLPWLEHLGGLVRVLTLAPELPGAAAAIARLSARGVLVALGHSACDAEVALEAAAAGARLVTHLGNAMGPSTPRAPGLVGAALADERLTVSLIADLVHSHPVFVRAAFAAKGAGGVALVTDAVAATAGTGQPPRLPDGRLAGSVLTVPRAVSNVVHHGAATLADAVASASTTPARLLGLGDRGVIAPGRRADLVALAPGPPGRAGGGGHGGGGDVGPWTVSSVWVAGVRAWPPR